MCRLTEVANVFYTFLHKRGRGLVAPGSTEDRPDRARDENTKRAAGHFRWEELRLLSYFWQPKLQLDRKQNTHKKKQQHTEIWTNKSRWQKCRR